MADDGFNGSRVTFPTTSTTVGSLRGISFDEGGAKVNVTSSTAATAVSVAGIPDPEVTIDLVGGSTIAFGSIGNLKVTWNDSGASGTFTKVVCVGRSVKGSMDGEITSTLKFAPTV